MVDLWKTTIGKKVFVAVSGAILIGYLILHMAGNLWSLAGPGDGVPHIDEYAEWLRTFGGPLIPEDGILWAVRLILLSALVVHVVGVVQLKKRNRDARPAAFPARRIGRSRESQLMMVSGIAILAFVIFHILQFTTLTIDVTPLTKGAIYANLYNAFQEWYFVLIYLIAVVLVGAHLRHAIWSLFQTLGLDNPERNQQIRTGASVLTVLLVAGFASVPILFYSGALGAPDGEAAQVAMTKEAGGS